MVDDQQLAQHIQQYEQGESGESGGLEDRVARLEESASGVHDELARRIEETRDRAADGSEVEALADRLSEIERRLSDIEEEL